ncbi:sulfurtransferase [Desulfobacula phenolica]|uniref:Thiosulfate/3-mercaptopyruvate sulfurtransferase n=1 Tax=Desulfobacula phenolica TaxID=90732 RepID=A0A1H2EGS9_9BACT|nr:rhodanese-like domain-containing protein [Desulfobacula phenolica]SDT94193.1 thiosulfate/3-mercaptopyruvate sulfurtransferase [Desulfobacula phenolica]
MKNSKLIRYVAIAAVLLLGVYWSAASAISGKDYPNAGFLASAEWLKFHKNDASLVIVDVRMDKYSEGKLIPKAVRMPWQQFQYDDTAGNMGGLFVGIGRAQQLLGEHGISRNDTVVLYDSVKRDGGATSSYIFWVLDLLGHKNMKVLERGIDSWIEAGGETVSEPRKPEAVFYQAPSGEIKLRKWVKAGYIMPRLGDPYYQILDVRSREEYLGAKPNTGLDGTALSLGHIPTAYNNDYTLNWTTPEIKAIKPYAALTELYSGLDPGRAVILYCHSARRGSFGYFILRLMGFEDAILYEPSWMEWGNKRYYHPVETAENVLTRDTFPEAKSTSAVFNPQAKTNRKSGAAATSGGGRSSKSGYVSCGG